MASYPITYIEIIIWLILVTYQDTDYWMRFIAKFVACFYGMGISISAFNGEQWLFVDGSGNLTLTQFKDGFQLPLSLIVLGLSLVLLMNVVLSLASKDWQKQDVKEEQ